MKKTPKTGRASAGPALLEQIKAYVQADPAGNLTLKQTAAHFQVSVSTVTQLFQKQNDTTFHDFVTGCRMEKALALIRQGMPLEAVGKDVGYQNHSTFYRAFCHTFGYSPREYRKKVASGETE